MKSNFNCDEIERILRYKFKNKTLLKKAFTHSSYANENNLESNERLEYLGDAVIEFIITERLYREFDENEGVLSKIRALVVSEKPLSESVKNLGLDKFLMKGVGESKNKNESKAVCCDLFEAICGAIYLDGGVDAVKKFFNMAVGGIIEKIKVNGFVEDPKTLLQEKLKQAKIVYVTKKTGADHCPHYLATVMINDVKSGVGEGANKKTAEENAASDALGNLKNI